MELPERKIYTISELTELVRDLLESEFPSVWVQGEISNLRAAPSGHFYFTLKDASAQIRCVMFKIQSRFLKFRPEEGLQVIAWGRLSVYGPRGEYQLILDTMEPVGLGSLMLAFEQLKNKLASEGLFDPSRKKTIPEFPGTIGIVTSPRGAAVRDMIRILTRRFPAIRILVSPASVQGDRAPDEIVIGLKRLCEAGDVDVVIVGRGGGSVEDLWAFNDERVVRAVAECPLPVVSAVGHETDVTLTDFAADMRASTPSAAAELLVPDRRDLADRLAQLAARLRNAMSFSVGKRRDALQETLKRLYDPRRQLQDRRITLDDLIVRLRNAMLRLATELRSETSTLVGRLRPEHLRRFILLARQDNEAVADRLERAGREVMKDARGSVEGLCARLDALSPFAVLSRGYSITTRLDTGAVVTDSGSVKVEDQVRVRLHRGQLSCLVVGTQVDDGDRPGRQTDSGTREELS